MRIEIETMAGDTDCGMHYVWVERDPGTMHLTAGVNGSAYDAAHFAGCEVHTTVGDRLKVDDIDLTFYAGRARRVLAGNATRWDGDPYDEHTPTDVRAAQRARIATEHRATRWIEGS